jgi:hypothetical protein
MPDGSQVYSYVIPASSPGAGIRLDFDGTNYRATTFGATIVAPAVAANEAVNLGQFPASLSSGGYQKLANGLIIQWGITGTLAATSSNIITLPIAFPNAGLAYIANSNDGGDSVTYRCNAKGGTTTSITIVNTYTSSIPGAAYLAIGY